jgi:exopolysaccharide biosynthesis polyprenyl glycosylphosphotransferase
MIAAAERDHRQALLIADILAFLIGLPATILVRFPHRYREVLATIGWVEGIFLVLCLGVLWYGCLRQSRAYRFFPSYGAELIAIVTGSTLFVLLVTATAFFSWKLFSRLAVLLFIPLATFITFICRRAVTSLVLRVARRQHSGGMLLVGGGEVADLLQECLTARTVYNVIRLAPNGKSSLAEQADAAIRASKPDVVVVAHEGKSLDEVLEVLNVCQRYRIPWHFAPTAEQLVLSRVTTQIIDGIPLISRKRCNIDGLNLAAKRCIDLALGIPLLLLTFPLMAFIWMGIRLTSKGRAIYTQERVGLGGKHFMFYKFRSMYVNSDVSQHQEYVQNWMQNKAYENGTFKITDDKRITPIGHLLRRYSLDELPQIFNVLKGDMSLVGPRPALAYEVEMYQDWHRERFDCPPGITGLWQVSGRNSMSFDEMIKLDIEYLRNWSPIEDIRVLMRTVPAVLFGTGH